MTFTKIIAKQKNSARLLPIMLLAIFVLSCSKKNDLNQLMLHNWETQYIKISMPTHNGSDSLFVFEDDFLKPNSIKAQSTYFADGSFNSWYLKDGEQLNKTKGFWSTKGDSLLIEYVYNNKSINALYHITPTKTGFKGKSIYDWDNDGEKDDTLVMKANVFNF